MKGLIVVVGVVRGWMKPGLLAFCVASAISVWGSSAIPMERAGAVGTTDPNIVIWGNDTGGTVWRYKDSAAAQIASSMTQPRSMGTDGVNLFIGANSTIVKTDLNGANPVDLVTGAVSAIFVDATYLFYATWNGGVYRANKDGSGVVQIVTPSANGAPASQFSGLYVASNYVYYIHYNNGNSLVYRRPISVGVTSGTSSVFYDGGAGAQLSSVWVTATDVFIANGSNSGWIKKFDVNGLNPVSLGTSNLYQAIYLVDNTIYYAAGSATIGKINVDGSGQTNFYTSASSPRGLVVLPRYSVTFVGNNNDGGSVPTDSTAYSSGSTFVVPGNTGLLTRTGYQFNGWEVTTGGTPQYPNVGANVTVTGNVTLSARWGGGPLEFSETSRGPAATSFEFPRVRVGQSAHFTLYVRNTGLAGVNISNVGGNQGGVSYTGGSCSSGGGTIQPFNALGTPTGECTYTFTFVPSQVSTYNYSFPVNYFAPQTVVIAGTPLLNPRVPTFGAPVSTADGFTVDVTNWDANWNFIPTISGATASIGSGTGSTARITVTGMAASSSAILSVTSTRSGYEDGLATVVGTALAAPASTNTTTPVITHDGASSSSSTSTSVLSNQESSSRSSTSVVNGTTGTRESTPRTGSNSDVRIPLLLIVAGLLLTRIARRNAEA